ncbi:hypothetical protein FPANT_9342 [Fusarium pseudoanthophilum]|uniref:Uncharacterized protein n=1 Tax=Fusarium pseudoanthophilum TaxID=48495 RepID=A0A8H5NV21_9HYPO|nr:hypothetical protein FPANT_9342 [Fusarium pseudoanthophilum]
MASRPDLARSVKTLFLKSRLLESLDFDKSRMAFDTCTRLFGSSSQELYRKTRKIRLSAIKRAFFLGTRTYTFLRPQEFLPIVGDQLLSILVAILPNLSHINIEEDRRWEFDVSPATLDNLGVRSIPLKTLETEHALPNLLARAPGLETLVTSASGEFPNMPCLRNLHIRSKDAVRAPAIEQLLSACTGALSTFSYTSFDSDIVGVVNLLDKPRFYASLETLHLNMLKTDSKGDHKMPSLKQFIQLKSLFLHTYFLYGSRSPTCCWTECKVKSLFDILPSSITSLDLSERTPTPDGRMYDDLLILSKDAAFAFPQLKEIRSNADHVCDEYPQTLFKSVGVDLIYQDPTICCWIDTVVRIIGSGDCYHYDLGYGGGAMPLPSELSDDDL